LTPGPRIEVRSVAPEDLAKPLSLLEESLRNGKPVPPLFAEQLAQAVERGDLELLAAWVNGGLVGVTVLAFRSSISLGAPFVSIEDLYVKPGVRRQGAGRALLGAVEERCKERGVSYVEVQTDGEAAVFYIGLGYKPEEEVRVLSCSYVF
jgi:GNAT superfamily N-acetyltransferase